MTAVNITLEEINEYFRTREPNISVRLINEYRVTWKDKVVYTETELEDAIEKAFVVYTLT